MTKRRVTEQKPYKYIFARILQFVIILIIAVSGFVCFKYGPELIRLYYDAAIKVNSSTVDTFSINKSNNINAKNNKDPLYLKSALIPQDVKNAFISIEDRNFYKHGGISIKAIFRSIYSIVTNDWRLTEGGSTITQQLSRNVFLNFDKNYKRKIEEMFIAVKMEQKYSKDQILEFYINDINFSNNAYGINTAAKKYFNEDCSKLNLSQICFLVAIPNDPEYYNPIKHYSNTIQRRNMVLEKMKEYGYITNNQYQAAINYKIILNINK